MIDQFIVCCVGVNQPVSLATVLHFRIGFGLVTLGLMIYLHESSKIIYIFFKRIKKIKNKKERRKLG
jgi:hypothetical protein